MWDIRKLKELDHSFGTLEPVVLQSGKETLHCEAFGSFNNKLEGQKKALWSILAIYLSYRAGWSCRVSMAYPIVDLTHLGLFGDSVTHQKGLGRLTGNINNLSWLTSGWVKRSSMGRSTENLMTSKENVGATWILSGNGDGFRRSSPRCFWSQTQRLAIVLL